MRRLRAWTLRVAGLLTGSRGERDFAAELESHLQLHVDDNIRAGMAPDQARREALVALGGVERTKDAYRDQRGVPAVDALVRDCRHGLRLLRKSPGFAAAAVLILGLGIGVNAAIFSLVNAVVLRPLPYADSWRIMRVWHVPPPELFSGQPTFAVSPANYLDWQSQSTAFSRMAIYGGRLANLTGQGDPDTIEAATVSEDFFPILGVQPVLGRTIGRADVAPGHEHVVVLSESLWKSRFGADARIVGRTILLNGEAHTVLGVVPQRLAFPDYAKMWLPLVWSPEERTVRGNHNYMVIAQLAPGASVQTAQAELTTISRRLERQYPADDKGWGALVRPLHADIVGDVRWPLLVLLGAVAFVLLIACANLANLLLARTLGRAKEIAIRGAIGASRARIVQQLLVESLLLGIGGGAVGLLAARFAVSAIVTAFGADLPRVAEIDLDMHVLMFAGAVAVLTGLIAGIAPAWRMTKGDTGEALKQGQGRGGSQAGERRVRNALVTSEVALALMLLVGAGLLIRTLWQLRAVDPGFAPANVLTMTVVIPQSRYPEPAQQTRFFDETLARVRALPGVDAAAGTDSLPLQGGSTQPVAIEGHPVVSLSEQPEVAVRRITPDYVSTLGMRVLDGRDLSRSDTSDRPLAVLISASMARRFWPTERPIGRHLTLGLISAEPREVVGVVNDVKLLGLDVREPVAAVYVPTNQVASRDLSFVVRTRVPPRSVVPLVINAIHSVDSEQAALDILTMDEVIGSSLAQQRFNMRLLTAFACLALALAAIGIYGVLSYTVRQRVREIGIRMALGAPASGVLRMMVIEGMKPTIVGLAIGIAAAAAVGRVLQTLIFGVGARDATTFVTVSLIVLGVGLVASLVPAYRATRIDPLRALRTD